MPGGWISKGAQTTWYPRSFDPIRFLLMGLRGGWISKGAQTTWYPRSFDPIRFLLMGLREECLPAVN